MNQIPNIEETHNTREVDGLKEFYSTEGIPEEMKQAISFMRQWLNEDRKATPMVTARDLWHWIGPTLHQQLQKAREGLKARIELLLENNTHRDNMDFSHGYRNALLDIESYLSELDQDNK